MSVFYSFSKNKKEINALTNKYSVCFILLLSLSSRLGKSTSNTQYKLLNYFFFDIEHAN